MQYPLSLYHRVQPLWLQSYACPREVRMDNMQLVYEDLHFFINIPTAPSSSPRSVQVTDVSSTGFLISWVAPPAVDQNGIIRNYSVSVTEENTGRMILLTSYSNSQRVDSIHPYYNYTCAVAAVTVSTGPLSAPITITTTEAGKYNIKFLWTLRIIHFCSADSFSITMTRP